MTGPDYSILCDVHLQEDCSVHPALRDGPQEDVYRTIKFAETSAEVTIRGFRRVGKPEMKLQKMDMFLGIPFAEIPEHPENPNLHILTAPVAATAGTYLTEEFDARRYGPACYKESSFGGEQASAAAAFVGATVKKGEQKGFKAGTPDPRYKGYTERSYLHGVRGEQCLVLNI